MHIAKDCGLAISVTTRQSLHYIENLQVTKKLQKRNLLLVLDL